MNDFSKPLALFEGKVTPLEIDNVVARPMEKPNPKFWFALAVALGMLGMGAVSVFFLVTKGIGVWGLNSPAFWGWDITNFVFWIGIAHAGTAISAILFIMKEHWRTAIARYAEAITLFSVGTALLFPLLHTGRPWLAHYLLPYPNERAMWVNFNSPLLWDVFAVNAYGICSFFFWYLGLMPDFATMRDRTKNGIRKFFYSLFSLGWRFSNRHWQHYERAYLMMAGLCTALVLSVCGIVSMDFATSVIPGWHATIFPLYFLVGALYAGFALISLVLIVIRVVYDMQHIITMMHLEKLAKLMVCSGFLVGYIYGMEFYMAYYSGMEAERYVFLNRMFGDYWWAFWAMMFCNVAVPQVLWFKACRQSVPIIAIVSIFVTFGMWFERFVIVVTSIHRDYLPASWGYFSPTIYDVSLFIGSFGLFFTGVLLFTRFLPIASMSEMKAVIPGAQPEHHGGKHE